MLHQVSLKRCENEELLIDFSIERPNFEKHARESAQAALDSMLFMLGLNIGDEKNHNDYRFVKKPYNNDPPTDLHVHGKINIIIVLNFLLENPRSAERFPIKKEFNDIGELEDTKPIWKKKLSELYVSCIDDLNMTVGHRQKVEPLIKSFLDNQYSELCKEKLALPLKNKVQENFGDNLLKHPLYQMLNLLLKDYDDCKTENGSKFFGGPSGTEYKKIVDKFLLFVPECYHGNGNIGSKPIQIDNKKIEKAGEDLPVQNIMQFIPLTTSASSTPSTPSGSPTKTQRRLIF